MGPAATMATIPWARISIGLLGIFIGARSTSRIPQATAASSRRSALVLGMNLPLAAARNRCPARPTRCRARATDLGDST